MAFRKISESEYEVQINGRSKALFVPFGTVTKIFSEFIGNGGVINEQGEVQTDIISLVSSFNSIGNLLLDERDDEGNIVKAGNCAQLNASEVIELFQVATDVISSFIGGLTAMKQETPNPQNEEEKSKSKKMKD